MRTNGMADTAPHKSARCRDNTRSDNYTQTSPNLRYLPQIDTLYKADIDQVQQDWTLGAPKLCKYTSSTIYRYLDLLSTQII